MVISYSPSVKFHGKEIWEQKNDHVISKFVLNEVCYKGIAL